MSELDQEFIIDLNRKLDALCADVKSVRDRQDEMLENVSKIKEAVYNPDEGLYARIRALEAWKNTSSKLLWTVFTAIVGMSTAMILKLYT